MVSLQRENQKDQHWRKKRQSEHMQRSHTVPGHNGEAPVSQGAPAARTPAAIQLPAAKLIK